MKLNSLIFGLFLSFSLFASNSLPTIKNQIIQLAKEEAKLHYFEDEGVGCGGEIKSLTTSKKDQSGRFMIKLLVTESKYCTNNIVLNVCESQVIEKNGKLITLQPFSCYELAGDN